VKEVSVKDLSINPMTMFAQQWMLLTAGTADSGYNTMTCSWGHLGSIWGHGGGIPTAAVYVRPQRYTKEFVDREEYYTISFFPGYKKELAYLGTHSGRDGDKVAEAGLTPVFADGYTYFAEASLVFVCRKLYRAPLKEEYFLDKAVMEEHYPSRDFHDLYIGEIVRVLAAE
jgi:flavin reductase (DIM6/NTAB) family NADH-FMN oxidoreductase RutF